MRNIRCKTLCENIQNNIQNIVKKLTFRLYVIKWMSITHGEDNGDLALFKFSGGCFFPKLEKGMALSKLIIDFFFPN